MRYGESTALHKRARWEIPAAVERLEFFTKCVGDLSKTREDVKTWSDYLDLDDHVTFGGKP